MGGVSPEQCTATHDVPTLVLSLVLITGLVISYLPQQHLSIISARTSEGISPWYLLLGATSSASGVLNLLIVQWPLFRCCSVTSAGRCFESLLGFYQVTLQWLLFSIVLVLFLIYFPKHLKYQVVKPISSSASSLAEPNYGAVQHHHEEHEAEHSLETDTSKSTITTTPEWRLAVTLAIVVALHLQVISHELSLASLLVLPPTTPPHPLLRSLATFLGVSATLLAILQYAPQIYQTYNSKLVGALSIGTMVIQVPGSVLFVLSLVFREGTDWTSWLAYAVTGGMQGALLVICLLWKQRQKRLGIDDFGDPLPEATESNEAQPLVNGQ
ncbi:hypothetical protein L198_01338 [Cryptococcus wingfieldii CBS 7118]|uniref:PQ loop repeat protein n=1 Tax=Cryptococcus wingfieldii CBS 7118 TaxID=1295528 RepID=A0A1E3JZ94_9TREE|nr:hypothetical protein L198_01338 [Cryptococcus wingfieldii CBS 7118]ODO06106.1 hypothetical protein L198_01338 [Cryptococcus wingfieldii CBS 7118]